MILPTHSKNKLRLTSKNKVKYRRKKKNTKENNKKEKKKKRPKQND